MIDDFGMDPTALLERCQTLERERDSLRAERDVLLERLAKAEGDVVGTPNMLLRVKLANAEERAKALEGALRDCLSHNDEFDAEASMAATKRARALLAAGGEDE